MQEFIVAGPIKGARISGAIMNEYLRRYWYSKSKEVNSYYINVDRVGIMRSFGNEMDS